VFRPFLLLGLLLFPGALLPPPGQVSSLPAGVAGRAGDRPFTFQDFHAYLVERFDGKEEGKQALQQVARCRTVEEEAARRGLGVTAEEVRRRRDELDRKLQSAGEPAIDSNLRARGIEREAFEDLLRLTLLHEKIVRAERSLPEGEEIPAEALAKWLEERLARVETSRSNLPPGAIALVGGRAVAVDELGRNVRHLLGATKAKELLLEALGARLVEDRAKALGLAPRPAHFEAEFERRRGRVLEDPTYGGATYDDLLRAAGSSLEEVRRDPRTRTAVLLDLIVEKSVPAERLADQFARERSRLELQYGEGRRASLLFLRAGAKEGEGVARTFEQAEEELRALLPKVADAERFGPIARERSEDEETKGSGGDLGVLHAAEKGRDPALLAAVFAAQPGALVGPLRLKEGVALVLVREKVPSPDAAVLQERLRAELRSRLYRELLGSSPLVTYLD
jgi:foldase protein PrsA